MNKLAIYGAGGHGKVLLDIAIKTGKYTEIIFLDDFSHEKNLMGHSVHNIKYLEQLNKNEYEFIVGIGENRIREKKLRLLEKYNLSIATLIHPQSIIGQNVTIGKGTVLMPGTIINIDTIIGESVIINTKASIDHDSIIGDFVHIAPGVNVAGNVKIGNYTTVGVGASIRNNVSICSECIIGVGAAVIKNIDTKGVYKGVPAK